MTTMTEWPRTRVHVGDCLEIMPTLDAESIDAIVTDPPYGLGFMGVKWDTYGDGKGRAPSAKATFDQVGGNSHARKPGGQELIRMKENQRFELRALEWFTAALRVAKPGAHLVAFGGTRTYHRLTCAIEDAGWEIRDCLSWLYGSGFPKSHNGPWGGTALKPAWEPIVLARKPLAGTVEANTTRYGTGALNIDGCRLVAGEGGEREGEASAARRYTDLGAVNIAATPGPRGGDARGRWPANVALDEDAAGLLDEQTGELTSGFMPAGTQREGLGYRGALGASVRNDTHGDSGGASRFFYTAKASRAERNAGLDGMPAKQSGMVSNTSGQHMTRRDGGEPKPAANHHPTVKPLALMRWLCRLVTPKGGLILDPFTGSGSTGVAAMAEGFSFVGIELSDEYASIARARITDYAGLFADGAA